MTTEKLHKGADFHLAWAKSHNTEPNFYPATFNLKLRG